MASFSKTVPPTAQSPDPDPVSSVSLVRRETVAASAASSAAERDNLQFAQSLGRIRG
jgi:hypothetical protein